MLLPGPQTRPSMMLAISRLVEFQYTPLPPSTRPLCQGRYRKRMLHQSNIQHGLRFSARKNGILLTIRHASSIARWIQLAIAASVLVQLHHRSQQSIQLRILKVFYTVVNGIQGRLARAVVITANDIQCRPHETRIRRGFVQHRVRHTVAVVAPGNYLPGVVGES